MHLRDALERTEIPVLLLSGWQDLFLEQTLEQYGRLRERGVDVAMTIGPWTHSHMMTKAAPTAIRESLDWLGSHLGGTPSTRTAPVRIHLAGDGWLDLPSWPPTMPERVFHLNPGGRLADTAENGGTATFVYNPAIRRPPSAAGCSLRSAATATTPRWPGVPTC